MSKLLPVLVAISILLAGCTLSDLGTPAPAVPPAEKMLPTLSGYTVVEGETLTGYLGKLSEADILQSRPDLAAMVGKVDTVIACYQQVGAVQSRLYSNQAQPWSVGAVAIADRNALLNPVNLVNCLQSPVSGQARTAEKVIEPCSASYTLPQAGNEFYILYVGTTPDICHAFCSNLEGCTIH